MKLFVVAAVSLMTLSLGANAQESKEGRDLVMYDPLFWKDELSLKNAQARRIEEINREFYDSLRRLRQVPHSGKELQSQLDFGLHERSVKIWSTLGHRQKKKLEKILEETALQGP